MTSGNYPETHDGVRQLVAAFPGELRMQAFGMTEQGASVAAMFDAGEACGTKAGMADMLALATSGYVANQCIQPHGSIVSPKNMMWSASFARRGCTRSRVSAST